MKSFAGPWLKTSVAHECTSVMSSTMLAVCGNSSETHAPHWPCCVNCAARAEELRPWLRVHEGEALALDERLAGSAGRCSSIELRLVVEQLELARPAGHEQVDDVLGARREVAGLGRQRIGQGGGSRAACEPALVEQRGQRDAAEADRAAAEEVAARLLAEVRSGIEGRTWRHGGHSRVMVSSRFSSTRATVVQAVTGGRRRAATLREQFSERGATRRGVGRAGQAEAEGVVDAARIVGAALALDARGEGARRTRRTAGR